MNTQDLARLGQAFLDWLADWHAALPQPDLQTVVRDPRRTAFLIVDVINAFCCIGPLASPRINGIVAPIAKLATAAHAAGVRHFISIQEDHHPEAVEFEAYPPHGIHGTEQSAAAPELKALPFWNEFVVMRKNSISASIGTGLDTWLDAHPEVDTCIVTGDCTDLCVYQLAMHLRLRANAFQQRGVRVIVPADCVATFDTPVDVARQIGALPHDGDLLHRVFLYHLALNRIEVVKRIVVSEVEQVAAASL
ncbi:MAG TPA: isochorismatase family cysteine hydrolase [Anaerolineae bacterium]|nr:isochorismatase family cysteine hydrolase [Anaerolineae bacterium]